MKMKEKSWPLKKMEKSKMVENILEKGVKAKKNRKRKKKRRKKEMCIGKKRKIYANEMITRKRVQGRKEKEKVN